MDDPNVNLKFQEDLKEKFENTSSKTISGINTCTLHKVHTSFKWGISKFSLDIDEFAVKLCSFLSYPVQDEKITLNYKN